MKLWNKRKNEKEPSDTTRAPRRKLTQKEKRILLIPCAAAVLAVLIVFLTMDKGTTYVFRQTANQYYGGSSAMIAEGTKMKRMEDGTVRTANGEAKDSCLPAYFADETGLVLTGDMICYTPRKKGFGLLRAFSEVNRAKNGVITLTYEKKTAHPDEGFLYDGNDFYIFLEPVRVSYMGYTVELSALSYAEVINGGHVMLFDYDTKNMFLEKLDGTVSAVSKDGAYTISLLGDSMVDRGGDSTLFAGTPGIYEPIL